MSAKTVRRLRYLLRVHLGQYPLLALPAFHLHPRQRSYVVSRRTEVVIEGYPRSANTFAVAAFSMAQPRVVRIAHHLHIPAQILRAAALGIPVIVLIRDPVEAAASLLVREPHITASLALKSYIAFYSRVYDVRDHYVTATFREVTTDFGSVIERLNAKFGTTFSPFKHTPHAVEAVMKIVEAMDREDRRAADVDEKTVARPSHVRAALKSVMRQRILGEPRLVRRAQEIYTHFLTATQ
ncbi:MAG: hypothetical protein KatS3mg082_3004 [Nitrospiraceae bacterium]|nr:MAG: hypothetical protein KatS3mg082_3004 [Nitrospiraceae bacterium]